nr:substrate-binding domain-containing protein [Paenibacillus sinopodophylli]
MPELTTVHVAKERLAQLAVDLILQSIGSKDQIKTKITVDTELVERHSSTPQREWSTALLES